MKLDHIVRIADQLEETKASSLRLGYTLVPIVDFEAHRSNVCFLGKEGEATVELVELYEDNKPFRMFLKKGGTLYHLCFEKDYLGIHTHSDGGGYIQLSEPLPAPAFRSRQL